MAKTCAEADAWATALMVLGAESGNLLARQRGLDALFLLRDGAGGVNALCTGPLFASGSAANA